MLKKILFPYYLISPFTGAKSFENPVIGSKFLNRLGLHDARIISSYYFLRLRQLPFIFLANKEERKSWRENGYIMKEDFLPPELFSQIEKAARAYKGNARQMRQGDTVTWRSDYNDTLRKVARHKPFRRLVSYATGRVERPMLYIQQIIKNEGGTPDPQRQFHSDSFQPVIKLWLFLEDVTAEKGPLNYVPASHLPTRERLRWEREKSLSSIDDKYSRRGSLRISEDRLKTLGLTEVKEFVVKKNTLVIANTHGFHRRGDALPGTTRLEIYGSSRTQPFSPLPYFSAVLRDAVLKAYFRYFDAKAAKKGVKPTWRRVKGAIKQ